MKRRDLLRSGMAATGWLAGAGLANAEAGLATAPLPDRRGLRRDPLDPPYPDLLSMARAYYRHSGYGQVLTLKNQGTLLTLGDRDRARVQDAYSGRWYWDCHRIGSLYNLGHRHPEILQAIMDALVQLEVGDAYYLSGWRAQAAEKLAASTGGVLPGVAWAASGSEANEAALKAARGFTGRRKIVTIDDCYHGHTGLMIAAGGNDNDKARYLLSYPDEFARVPWNDLDAMAAAVDGSTAAVLLEALLAKNGFREPDPGYYAGVLDICRANGALLIVDEVITGIGSTGTLWYLEQQGIDPDMLTTAKGLSGGLIPNAAMLMSQEIYSWFASVFQGHQTTFGGSELGCVATSATLDVVLAPGFLANVQARAQQFYDGFQGASFGVTGVGLCLGLQLPEPNNAEAAGALFDAGVLVAGSRLKDVLQLRPPLILDQTEAAEIIDLVRTTLDGLYA